MNKFIYNNRVVAEVNMSFLIKAVTKSEAFRNQGDSH
jgi:hypothetical protein